MTLEIDSVSQWIGYTKRNIDEIVLEIDRRKAEETYQKKQSIKNGIHVLANMYTYFLEVLSGKNPPLTKDDLERFKGVLDQFKRLNPKHWVVMEYPSVLPELELAHSGLTNYVYARYQRRYKKAA
jgi:hypothetical protein